VGQFLVGQDYDGLQASLDRAANGVIDSGDPSLSFAAPTEQYRADYSFLIPDSYAENWITITAPKAATVMVDGNSVDGLEPITGTDMASVHVKMEAGAHIIEATSPVGVQVYGFGSYTSYMFPAGLDFKVVNLL
jgi:hypothetical protein